MANPIHSSHTEPKVTEQGIERASDHRASRRRLYTGLSRASGTRGQQRQCRMSRGPMPACCDGGMYPPVRCLPPCALPWDALSMTCGRPTCIVVQRLMHGNRNMYGRRTRSHSSTTHHYTVVSGSSSPTTVPHFHMTLKAALHPSRRASFPPSRFRWWETALGSPRKRPKFFETQISALLHLVRPTHRAQSGILHHLCRRPYSPVESSFMMIGPDRPALEILYAHFRHCLPPNADRRKWKFKHWPDTPGETFRLDKASWSDGPCDLGYRVKGEVSAADRL